MANNIARIIVGLGTVVGRAFSKALRKEIIASQQAAKARATSGGRNANQSAAADSMSGISLQEAKQVLNIEDFTDKEKLEKSFDHLFKVNDKAKGGSFYLQSKVVRAKERLDEELKLQEDLEQKEQQRQEKDT